MGAWCDRRRRKKKGGQLWLLPLSIEIYNYCKKSSHEIANCFQLNGYSEWWGERTKSTANPVPSGVEGVVAHELGLTQVLTAKNGDMVLAEGLLQLEL